MYILLFLIADVTDNCNETSEKKTVFRGVNIFTYRPWARYTFAPQEEF